MKIVYISGSISDPTTNQPRKGWQKDFLDAEARLRRMGFQVINPVDIAREVEDALEWRYYHVGGPCSCNGGPEKPSRADYIMACLQRMQMAHEAGALHGVYVIGSNAKAMISDGVRMELHLAHVLNIPIYAEFHGGHRVNTTLIPQVGFDGIEELLKED